MGAAFWEDMGNQPTSAVIVGAVPLREAGSMRTRSLPVALLLGLLVIGTAVPAHAAPRLRLYRGDTSQGHRISFIVARTDAGRFIREFDARKLMFTCEDDTTQEIGVGYGLRTPIIDQSFSIDEVDQTSALHVAGQMGSLQGQGTLTLAFPFFTPDEQAQVCTTGDLTWTVEFVRRL